MEFPRETKTLSTGCVELTGPRPKARYRAVKIDGLFWGIHRLSYHLNNASIPRKPGSTSEGFVLHTCDNKHCINPDHLYLGNQVQNMADRNARCVGWKEKIAAWHRGRKHTPETLRKMSDSHKGLKQSAETVEKRRKALLGQKRKPHTEEAKAKMRAAWAEKRRTA